MIETLRKQRDVSLKHLVNDLLREALLSNREKKSERTPYRMIPVHLGDCLVSDLDDIAEVLAEAEGDFHR